MDTTTILKAEIRTVYSGKPGCGCGCRGTYWNDIRNITRIRKILLKHADEVQEMDGILYLESPTRYYWAYPTEQ